MHNLNSYTLGILRGIFFRYKETSDTMKGTLLNILMNIKNAYYKFIRADKLLNILYKKPAEIVTVEIMRRYKNNIERIQSKESSYKIQLEEISTILDLLRAFFVINYKKHITESKNKGLYKIFIFDKIVEIFKNFEEYIYENENESYHDIKDFTALLLLKMEHKKHIIFDIYSIQGFLNIPVSSFKSVYGDSVKVYFEFIDSLMIIPGQCDSLTKSDLRDCV